MLTIAETVRQVLVPFLVGGTVTLLLLLALLIGQRGTRALLEARREARRRRYRPLVTAALAVEGVAGQDALRAVPRRHRGVVAELLLAPLRIVRGLEADRARAVAERLGLTARWRADLDSGNWSRCAEAALALGLVRDQASVHALSRLLDHGHEQVRAAAIDALGQIGDPASIPALLARVNDQARHERARMVEALRAFGDAASAALTTYGQSHPGDRGLMASVLAHVGGASAGEPLLEWAADPDAVTRAAAWHALASIGLDDRAFYHALKALGDPAAPVRAAAALALAKVGRGDAAGHLADHLDDEWEVAAQAARALGRLGPDGVSALHARDAEGPGLGHELARQVLWEGGRR